jgi:hypothetical protein
MANAQYTVRRSESMQFGTVEKLEYQYGKRGAATTSEISPAVLVLTRAEKLNDPRPVESRKIISKDSE